MISILNDGRGSVLCCPKCNGEFLHQLKVTSIFRDAEDKGGTQASHSIHNAIIDRLESEKIAGRRDIMYINFSCEGCSHLSTLFIQQHKGETIIDWK